MKGRKNMKKTVKKLTVVLIAFCVTTTGIIHHPEKAMAAYRKTVSKKLTVYQGAEYDDARNALSINLKKATTVTVTVAAADKKSDSFVISHGGSLCKCGGDPVSGYKESKGKKTITLKLKLSKGKHLIRFECSSNGGSTAGKNQKLKVTFKAKNNKPVLKVSKVSKISEGSGGNGIVWK